MGRYEIYCIRHDAHNVITHVGVKGLGIYPVIEIANMIRSGQDTFYTYRDGHLAEVYARQRSDTGRWYLTTEPDGTDENNLDFLPYCDE